MLIISGAITLDPVESDGPDHPLIGYDQIVTTTNVAADTEETGYPISRVANPETHLYWMGADTTEQYVTVTTDGFTEIQYIGIVGHNFGSGAIAVSIEKYLSGSWVEIESPVMPADDSPIMWRVDTAVMPEFRIRMQSGDEAPRMAVLQAGSLLVMEQRLYAGHAPIPYQFSTSIANGFSESGRFLGRVVLGETRMTSAEFRLITPEWFREKMPAFLAAAQERPFFWVWRPATYPDEVGYVVLADDVSSPNADPGSNNLVMFTLKMEGVAS